MHKKYMVRLTAAERKTPVEAIKKLKGTSEKVRHTQILLQADVEDPAGSDARIAEPSIAGCTPSKIYASVWLPRILNSPSIDRNARCHPRILFLLAKERPS